MIKMPRPRLLGFLLFHIPKPGMHVLLNPREIPIKELFFKQNFRPAVCKCNKTKFLEKIFQGFRLLFGNS